LKRRLQIVAATASNIEALAVKRHEIETEASRDGADRQPAIGLAVGQSGGDIGLGRRRTLAKS
jgi:hypothetical protein